MSVLVENGLTTQRNLYYAHLETGRDALFFYINSLQERQAPFKNWERKE